MESRRLYFKGDINSIALNLNFIFKPSYEGYYSYNNGLKANNFPIDSPYGFIEITTDDKGKFAFQRIYAYYNEPYLPSDYSYVDPGNELNIFKCLCFTRSGIFDGTFIKWGKWAMNYNVAPSVAKINTEARLNILDLKLIPKVQKELLYLDEYGRQTVGRIESLQFLSQGREYRTDSALSLLNINKYTCEDLFNNERPEVFAYRYLGQVKEISDFDNSSIDPIKRWETWFNNKYATENFNIPNNPIINGYFVKRPGVRIDIPESSKDAYGILKVFTYPMNETQDQSDMASLPNKAEYTASLDRGMPHDKYDSDLNPNNAFKGKKIARMYIYEQYNPSLLMNQFIWHIYAQNDDIYPLDKMPVPKLLIEGDDIPWDASTGNLISDKVNPYGWYNIKKAHNYPMT